MTCCAAVVTWSIAWSAWSTTPAAAGAAVRAPVSTGAVASLTLPATFGAPAPLGAVIDGTSGRRTPCAPGPPVGSSPPVSPPWAPEPSPEPEPTRPRVTLEIGSSLDAGWPVPLPAAAGAPPLADGPPDAPG